MTLSPVATLTSSAAIAASSESAGVFRTGRSSLISSSAKTVPGSTSRAAESTLTALASLSVKSAGAAATSECTSAQAAHASAREHRGGHSGGFELFVLLGLEGWCDR